MLSEKVRQKESLGAFLVKKSALSMREVKRALERGAAKVNGTRERFANTLLFEGDLVTFHLPEKQNQEIEILLDTPHLFAIHKHPHIRSEALFSAFASFFPVHRLDKETSGVLLFAKDRASQQVLEALFKERQVEKKYLAWVCGSLEPKEGQVINRLGLKKKVHGKSVHGPLAEGLYAETFYQVVRHEKGKDLVLCMPKTGRTHQIRAHLSGLGHPIIGDLLYGSKQFASRIFLHAACLSFPFDQQQIMIEAKNEDFDY